MRGFFQAKPGSRALTTSEACGADNSCSIETMQEESNPSASTSDLGLTVSLGYESDLANDEPIDMPN